MDEKASYDAQYEVCEVHPPPYRHRPTFEDVEVHHVWPIGTGGADVVQNRRGVCPTGHSNIHALIRIALRAGKGPQELPYAVRRRFATGEVLLAQLGYLCTVGHEPTRALFSKPEPVRARARRTPSL